MQARCVVPQAMPVPLPYPGIFNPTVLRYGDLVPQEPHQNASVAGMHSSVLPGFRRRAVPRHARQLRELSGSGQ